MKRTTVFVSYLSATAHSTSNESQRSDIKYRIEYGTVPIRISANQKILLKKSVI
jgi:hypothetical protein